VVYPWRVPKEGISRFLNWKCWNWSRHHSKGLVRIGSYFAGKSNVWLGTVIFWNSEVFTTVNYVCCGMQPVQANGMYYTYFENRYRWLYWFFLRVNKFPNFTTLPTPYIRIYFLAFSVPHFILFSYNYSSCLSLNFKVFLFIFIFFCI